MAVSSVGAFYPMRKLMLALALFGLAAIVVAAVSEPPATAAHARARSGGTDSSG